MANRISRALLVLLVAGFAVLLLRPFDIPDPFHLEALSWTAICAVFGAAILLVQWISGVRPRSDADLAIWIYVAIVAVNIPFGVDPRNSIVWLASLLANLAIFYATVGFVRTFDRGREAWLAFLYASITLLLLLATEHHAEQGLLARPKTYLVPEGWSGYPELAMLGAVHVALLMAAIQAGGRRLAVLAAVQMPLSLAALALLYARGAWVAVGLTAATAAAVVLARRGGARRLLLVGGVAVALLAGLMVSNPTLRLLLTGGPATTIEGHEIEIATPQMRFDIWRRTLRMIRDHPLGGIGPGNFQQVFERVYNPQLNNDLRRGVHAHNDWLQQFGELGLPGGLAYLFLWIVVLRIGWMRVMRRADFGTLGSLLALVAVGATNLLTDMFFMLDSASGRLHTLCWVLFALVVAPLGRDARAETSLV